MALFHDCGIPMLMKRFPNYTETLKISATPLDIIETENTAFQTNHTVAGRMLVRHLSLPDIIIQAVGAHRNRKINLKGND